MRCTACPSYHVSYFVLLAHHLIITPSARFFLPSLSVFCPSLCSSLIRVCNDRDSSIHVSVIGMSTIVHVRSRSTSNRCHHDQYCLASYHKHHACLERIPTAMHANSRSCGVVTNFGPIANSESSWAKLDVGVCMYVNAEIRRKSMNHVHQIPSQQVHRMKLRGLKSTRGLDVNAGRIEG